MKHLAVLSFLFAMVLNFTLGCSEKKQPESKVVAKINGYELTLEEFQYHLASELEFQDKYKLTREVKQEFLEQLIRKQLLIQEAKRLKLDTKEDFIRAIEKYWESTLIKNLIDLKAKEISKRCVVSEEEITARYEKIKSENPHAPPLEAMRQQIAETLKEEKKTRLLEEWINDLRKNAKIKVNDSLL